MRTVLVLPHSSAPGVSSAGNERGTPFSFTLPRICQKQRLPRRDALLRVRKAGLADAQNASLRGVTCLHTIRIPDAHGLGERTDCSPTGLVPCAGVTYVRTIRTRARRGVGARSNRTVPERDSCSSRGRNRVALRGDAIRAPAVKRTVQVFRLVASRMQVFRLVATIRAAFSTCGSETCSFFKLWQFKGGFFELCTIRIATGRNSCIVVVTGRNSCIGVATGRNSCTIYPRPRISLGQKGYSLLSQRHPGVRIPRPF